ncbi:MAG: hypothetical protein HY680_03030 [Chloroflexi bacterium]|nr:hypothetical protein [Chloroflexota bacterium]
MIILRRILAVLLAILFIPLFLVALIVFQANSTVFSASFYVAQLRKADPFNFAYDQLLPAAFEEQSKAWQEREAKGLPQSFPFDPREVQPQATELLKTTLPPEWLEEQAEAVILAMAPYAVGDTEAFNITVPLAPVIQNLGEGIKKQAADPKNYTLAFDKAIGPAVDDALGDAGKLPLGITIRGQDVTAAARQVVSQEWLARTTAQVVDQVVPYATGKADHFAITVALSDRVEAAGPPVKDLLAKSGVYEALESQEFRDALDTQLKDFGALPFGVRLSADQLAATARELAPPDWLKARTEQVVDALVPYLSGREKDFVVVILLKDRVAVAAPVVKKLLRDTNAYQLAFDGVVDTLVKGSVSEPIALPLGATVTPEEVGAVLRQALPPSFIQEQAENAIDEMVPYLTGQHLSFRIAIPLAIPKEEALGAIESLVRSKLEQAWGNLPPCSFNQAVELLTQAAPEALPSCRPIPYTLGQMKQALDIPPDSSVTEEDIAQQLGVDVALLTQGVTFQWLADSFGDLLAQQVRQLVGDAIPEEFVYTDADLRKTLGAADEERLDSVLAWTRSGYKFTDADLRGRLDAEGQKTLDNVLKWTREGVRYTDADLRADISQDGKDTEALETYEQALGYVREGFMFTQDDLREQIGMSEDGQQALETMDTARKVVGTFRKLSFLVYLVVAPLLAGIGFLGGRSWRGRLAWAAVPLLLASALAFALFGPVYNALIWPLMDDAIAQSMQDAAGVQLLALTKAQEVVRSLSDAIVGGMARVALLFLVLSIAGLAAVVFWKAILRAQDGVAVTRPP